MFTDYRVILVKSKTAGCGTLVLHGVVEKVAFAAFQLNFFTFCCHVLRSKRVSFLYQIIPFRSIMEKGNLWGSGVIV